MRTFATPLPLLLAAIRALTRLRPSDALMRALVRFMAAALAAMIGCLCLHPPNAIAQVPVDVAASAAQPTEPALKPPGRQQISPRAAPASPGKATASNRQQLQPHSIPDSTRQDIGSTERLVWDKAPLQITLGVGPANERSITFPAQMHIGVPQEVAQLLRVQTVGRTTYVTALAPFSRTRVVAEDRTSGAVILLDLIASVDSKATHPVSIVAPPAPESRSSSINGDDEGTEAQVDMVTLTRFAAQQMYAPRRLAGAHPAIRRVLVDKNPVDDLYAGGGLRGTPAAQWRGDDFYVTAVVLRNLGAQPVELSPLDIRGRWRAITFQHGRLLAAGTEADTTVVYLVCERPFDACR
jgi:integrating conjugative element protein (TIGR03749 family)